MSMINKAVEVMFVKVIFVNNTDAKKMKIVVVMANVCTPIRSASFAQRSTVMQDVMRLMALIVKVCCIDRLACNIRKLVM